MSKRPGSSKVPMGKSIIKVTEDKPPRPQSSRIKPPKKESLMQWFDKSCEKKLQKHRNRAIPTPNVAGQSGLRHPRMVASTTSGIDVTSRLKSGPETELTEAVEKLATAEAMCAFEGAVIAAERAAANAPPELAEEAAAASARGYQSLVTSVIRESVGGTEGAGGVRPVEVVGYVGITRPKKPIHKQY